MIHLRSPPWSGRVNRIRKIFSLGSTATHISRFGSSQGQCGYPTVGDETGGGEVEKGGSKSVESRRGESGRQRASEGVGKGEAMPSLGVRSELDGGTSAAAGLKSRRDVSVWIHFSG
jgi:hypothetical protein